jgi:hypothetical protein
MKILRGILVLVRVLIATCVATKSLSGKHLITEDSPAPSCKIFNEMLRRIYYMHSRLDAVTDSLGTIGYKLGREWEADQGIGIISTDNMTQVMCPLLAGAPKPTVADQASAKDASFLSAARKDPPESKAVNMTSKGCPPGSPQLHFLEFVQHEFKGTAAEAEKLKALKFIFVDLLKSVEDSLLSLYSFRECPLGKGEFKTRQMCQLHREELSKALKIFQSDLPEMRSRVNRLKSRVKAIDRGISQECYLEKEPQKDPHSNLHEEYCLNISAVADAILDGRAGQSLWLKSLGQDMQRMGIMAMQLRNRMNDPVLKADKVPLNALSAFKESWGKLEPVMQMLRLLGSTRAEHAGTVDGSLLGLAGLLKNVSTENGCLAESFRLRYSARSCDSLKKQLESSLHARENDLEHLEDGANGILTSSGNDLVAMNCTADPETEGCWFRLPDGCSKIPKWKTAKRWTRDIFGEESTGSGQDGDVCMKSRKLQVDLLCGVENTEMRFIPGATM